MGQESLQLQLSVAVWHVRNIRSNGHASVSPRNFLLALKIWTVASSSMRRTTLLNVWTALGNS